MAIILPAHGLLNKILSLWERWALGSLGKAGVREGSNCAKPIPSLCSVLPSRGKSFIQNLINTLLVSITLTSCSQQINNIVSHKNTLNSETEKLLFLQAQNNIVDRHFRKDKRLIETIKKELSSPPVTFIRDDTNKNKTKIGNFRYFLHNENNQRLPIILREDYSGSHQIALNLNYLTLTYPKAELVAFKPSDSGRWIAFLARKHPAEQPSLYISPVPFKKEAVTHILDAINDVVWGNTDELIYYTKLAKNLEPRSVHRYDIVKAKHINLMQTHREGFSYTIKKDLLNKSLLVNLNNIDTCQPFVIPLTNALPRIEVINDLINGQCDRLYSTKYGQIIHRTSLEHGESIELSNERLQEAGLFDSIEQIKIDDSLLKIITRKNLTYSLIIYDLQKAKIVTTERLDPGWKISLKSNGEAKKESYLNAPLHLRDSARMNGSLSLLNTPIPITLLESNIKTKKLLLKVYGAYGHTQLPKYSPELKLLLSRGVSVAFCHTRGGGFKGPKWWAQGRGSNKLNGVIDAVECTKKLKELGFKDITLYGRSAGGLLASLAARTNQTAFKKLILETPFLNPAHTLVNQDQHLAAREISEWGTPQDIKKLNSIDLISPNYPETLILSSYLDNKVRTEDAIDLISKMHRKNITAYMATDIEGTHTTSSSIKSQLERQARIVSFILN